MKKLVFVLVSLLLLLIQSGCSKERKATSPGLPAYAGSTTCQKCHADIYAEYKTTGHAYILNKVVGGVPPVYPNSSVPNPPSGYSWDDITYVVGGYGWKAAFLDLNGNFISGENGQYNIATRQFVAFQPDTVTGSDAYGQNCARCHTTGYSSIGHQDNLSGINGTWNEPGVTCEGCHGPGSQHAVAPREFPLPTAIPATICGDCHSRHPINKIQAFDGLIVNYQQYNEMHSDGHHDRQCTDCHDPHKSARYDPGGAITGRCPDCHPNITIRIPEMANVPCQDCHMPYSVLSAVTSGTGVHRRGDVRSHIYFISNDTTQSQFFGDQSYAYNGLNFACFSTGCHSALDLRFAAENSVALHNF
jgi:hypothetical protein